MPTLDALLPPQTDPTPIFEIFRGSYATELLTAAVHHFKVFHRLNERPLAIAELGAALGLADRPTMVLVTALRAFGLLSLGLDGRLTPTAVAREHLAPDAPFSVADYVGLAAQAPHVQAMITCLTTNKPLGAQKADDEGAAFIYREGVASAMEKEASARALTLALAGRAKNVAPHLAAQAPLAGAEILLDVGGGTGIYAIACLQKHLRLRAIVWDRPEVLKVAAEFAAAYGVADRLELRAGDMFSDPVPAADVMLVSNILHDWDVPECRALIRRCADRLRPGGCLLIHDVFLSDALDGPLPIALYSAALFTLTEGRVYSAGEYRDWLAEAGLVPAPLLPTLIHCGILPGHKA